MKPSEVIGYETHIAERIAARHNLDFYICGETMLVERVDCSEVTREPTGPELSMWYATVPREEQEVVNKMYLLEVDVLASTPEEVYCSLSKKKGDRIYLNAKDAAHVRRFYEYEPETQRDRLLSGIFGTWKEAVLVYVSRHIPEGYCLWSNRLIPELTWRVETNPRGTPHPIDEHLKCILLGEMEPLKVDHRIVSEAKQKPAPTLWKGEVCQKCGRRNCVTFRVSDDAWQRVVDGECDTVCTTCFDEMAEKKRVAYQFISAKPKSWSDSEG